MLRSDPRPTAHTTHRPPRRAASTPVEQRPRPGSTRPDRSRRAHPGADPRPVRLLPQRRRTHPRPVPRAAVGEPLGHALHRYPRAISGMRVCVSTTMSCWVLLGICSTPLRGHCAEHEHARITKLISWLRTGRIPSEPGRDIVSADFGRRPRRGSLGRLRVGVSR